MQNMIHSPKRPGLFNRQQVAGLRLLRLASPQMEQGSDSEKAKQLLHKVMELCREARLSTSDLASDDGRRRMYRARRVAVF
jgi:hypothetical protein